MNLHLKFQVQSCCECVLGKESVLVLAGTTLLLGKVRQINSKNFTFLLSAGKSERCCIGELSPSLLGFSLSCTDGSHIVNVMSSTLNSNIILKFCNVKHTQQRYICIILPINVILGYPILPHLVCAIAQPLVMETILLFQYTGK